MGFIVREIIQGMGSRVPGERSVQPPPLPILPTPLPFFPKPMPPVFDVAAIEALCWRPDIRQAVINNCRALMELLSHDEVALKNFTDLLNRLAPSGGERFVPFVVAGVALIVGGIVGYASRK